MRPGLGAVAIVAAASLMGCTAAEASTNPTPAPVTNDYPRPLIKSQIRSLRLMPHSYRVKKSDTLTRIAAKVYGSAKTWPALWWVNRSRIHDPATILAGQWLHLSTWHPQRSWLRRAAEAAIAPVPPSQPPVYSTPALAPPVTGVLSFTELEALWDRAAPDLAWAAGSAAQVAECESGGRINAANPSGAAGLWQILGQVVKGYIFDPFVNALNAVAKFRAAGNTFGPWVCQPMP